MKEFDYTIIGGGCAGLSLAYELEINNKLSDKTLAIIEPRTEYQRDKTWSFWKTFPHNFEDCVIKSWDSFSINIPNKSKQVECESLPYQSVDSGLFYRKTLNRLKANKNIHFFRNKEDVNTENSYVFNSVPKINSNENDLWQHFGGYEIETDKNIFDDSIINLMDFDCDQKNSVHFFYTLPFSKNKALIETTWLSNMKDPSEKDYDFQIKEYIENILKIKNYKIIYKEKGQIPLFYPSNLNGEKKINIGTAGKMTRLSTGYTFLNIQEHCKYIVKNLDNLKTYNIGKKYEILDKIFLKVLKKNAQRMPNIFFEIFNSSSETSIKFLSNKSNIFQDLSIISKMPKWPFIKALFN